MPPEYKPLKMCLRSSISPGLIFGTLRYSSDTFLLGVFVNKGILTCTKSKRNYSFAPFRQIPVLIDLDLFNDNQFETGWLKIFGKDNLCTGADQYLKGISPNHMHE